MAGDKPCLFRILDSFDSMKSCRAPLPWGLIKQFLLLVAFVVPPRPSSCASFRELKSPISQRDRGLENRGTHLSGYFTGNGTQEIREGTYFIFLPLCSHRESMKNLRIALSSLMLTSHYFFLNIVQSLAGFFPYYEAWSHLGFCFLGV